MELILKKIDEVNKFMYADFNRLLIMALIMILFIHIALAYKLYNKLFSEFETFEFFGYKFMYIYFCSIPILVILYSIIF